MRQLNRTLLNFFAYQSGALVLVFTSLLLWPLLAKSMDLASLGKLVLAISISSLIAPVLSGGLGISLSYYGGRKNLATNPSLFLVSSLWILALFLANVVYFLFSFSQPATELFAWVAIIASSASALLITSGALRALGRPMVYFFVTLITSLTGLCFVLLAPQLIGKSTSIFFGFVAAAGIGVASTFVIRALPKPRILPSKQQLYEVLRLSLVLGVHQLMAVALLLGVRVIVGVVLGDTSLAAFLFCALLVGSGLTLGSTLDGYWSIEAQKAETQTILHNLLRHMQVRIQWSLFSFSALACGFWVTLGNLWLPFGVDSKQISLAIALGLPAWGLQAYADSKSASLIWQNKRVLVSVSTGFSVVIAFGLCIWLLPIFGISAATMSVSFGMLARLLALQLLDSNNPIRQLKSSYVAFLLTLLPTSIFLFV